MQTRGLEEIGKYDVVHLVRLYSPNIGGMELIVEEIASRQVAQGKKVAVVSSDYIRTGEIHESFARLQGVDVYRLPSASRRGIIFPALSSLFQVTRPGCTTLHVHGLDPFVDLNRMLIRHEALLMSPHGGFFHTTNNSFLKKIYWNVVTKPLYRDALCLTISNADLNLVDSLSRNAFHMGCGYAGRNVYSAGQNVLILGRIALNKQTQKSVDLGAAAFSDREVFVVGPTEPRMRLIARANTRVMGALPEEALNECIKHSGFFICLSDYEGLGMTLIEALDAGLRCIISKIDTFVEIAEALDPLTRQAYTYFWDGDYQALARWINSHSIPSKEAVRSAVSELYSWDAVVEKIDLFSKEVLNHGT